MFYEETFKFIIVSVIFFSQFSLNICHLKDLGELHPNLTDFISEFEDRILGGVQASLEDFPFNVQFLNMGGLCGGSILTAKTVLTAAHCFDHNTNIAEMKIMANSLKAYDRRSQRHEVWDYVIHEVYNKPERYSNDIALIIIHNVFEFGPTVQKAVLTNSTKWMSERETGFVATGWGITETRRRVLQKTRLRYISPKNCMKMSGLPVTEDMFCLFGDLKNDTCQGDSGGGVLWNKVLVGIVSHGDNCLKSPGAYANLYHFRHWISNNVQQLYKRYCNFHKVGHQYTKVNVEYMLFDYFLSLSALAARRHLLVCMSLFHRVCVDIQKGVLQSHLADGFVTEVDSIRKCCCPLHSIPSQLALYPKERIFKEW